MKIRVIESCGSTNEELKKDILSLPEGSPLPPAVMAIEQTAGKGRSGRSFSSAYGKGLYLSLPVELTSVKEALPIMPMVSVCVSRAIESECAVVCDIKWPNDILINGRKLCGILSELVPHDGHIYAVIGIGVNLSQEEDDFPGELREKAISLKQACGKNIEASGLADILLSNIENMIKALPEGKADILEYYRSRCSLIGKEINVFFSENSDPEKAEAIEITEDFRLCVRWENGSCEILNTGEVSVR